MATLALNAQKFDFPSVYSEDVSENQCSNFYMQNMDFSLKLPDFSQFMNLNQQIQELGRSLSISLSQNTRKRACSDNLLMKAQSFDYTKSDFHKIDNRKQQQQQLGSKISQKKVELPKKSEMKVKQEQMNSENDVFSCSNDGVSTNHSEEFSAISFDKYQDHDFFLDNNNDSSNRSSIEKNIFNTQQYQQQQGLKFASQSKKNFNLESKNNSKPNQDSIISLAKIHDMPDVNMFTVCDGHGEFGHNVSQFIQKNLKEKIESQEDLLEDPQNALYNAMEEIQEQLICESEIDLSGSGSTAVSALVIQDQLFVSNIGDSRVVLGQKCEKDIFASKQLSNDHNLNNFEEYERIEEYGGLIKRSIRSEELNKDMERPLRVWVHNPEKNNSIGLGMSRSLGDSLAEEVGVISEAEIEQFKLDQNDCFLVLGSDGLYDVMSNQEICNLVGKYYRDGDVQGASEALLKEAVSRWCQNSLVSDDISFSIVFLNQQQQC